MKTTIIAAYVFVFSLSIITGYWLGQQSTINLSPIPQTDETYPLPVTTHSEQVNLLVTFVNRIDDSSAKLQMIWLVAINLDTPIKLIPVYPSPKLDQAEDLELSSNFELLRQNKQFVLNQNTIQILKDRELDWDGIIVLDNLALAYIIDTFGSIHVNDDIIDRNQLAEYKLPKAATIQSSLTFQTLLWREVCWNILHSPDEITNLNKDFYKHTSVTFNEIISDLNWISLLTNVKIPSCEFPLYFQNNP